MKTTLCLIAVAALPLAAQSTRGPQAWTPPRTPDGQIDLQGVWTNATITPFERPASLRDKAFLTKAEAASLERQAAERRDQDGAPPQPGEVGNYNQAWFDSGERVVSTLRTSLVIDPPDGRVPLGPKAEAARNNNTAHENDSYEFMSVWDRCITRGVPGGMFPAGYNNAYQIVQTPGFVVIHYEMIHEARIIPLGGAHPPAYMRAWNGDSRGRWDGGTLVVDTTNYNGKGWITTSAAGGRIKGVPQTPSLHVVERFTPIDANTIDYEATLDDPAMFARPWTVSIPLHRDARYRIFEYACHEGNHAVENVLRGARAQERR